jgi:2-oxoglutarate dehydrogenase complex dihydrolipoamide succinyltransferase (E2) component
MPISIVVPQMGESIVEGTIGKWVKKVGDKVARDEVMLEILTDKVTVEVPSAFAGTLARILVQEGEVVKVEQEIAILLREGEDEGALEEVAVAVETPPARSEDSDDVTAERIRTSPAVRKLARELGINLKLVAPTGPKGRVRKADLEAYLQRKKAATARTVDEPQPAPLREIQSYATSGEEIVEAEPLSGVRKMISHHMVLSKQTSAHVMTMDEVDLTSLVEFRKKHRDRILQEYGLKLTYMPFFVKAVTTALRNHPRLNASITDTEVLIRKYYHIGVAVAREEGLIVPVVKHADTKGILQLAAEIQDLADRARREALTPDDVSGGTFTLTNAGMFGALASTPIINQPQVAILGIHAIQKRPVVRHNQIVARDMMYLTISFDHRLVDGHTAVGFLREVCVNLEEPANMLLT